MPELPEVETIVQSLTTRVMGRRIAGVAVARADVIHGDRRKLRGLLVGHRIEAVFRRGKRIALWSDSGGQLVFHLGMSGRLRLVRPGTPIERHTHLRIELDSDDGELRFSDPRRFGGVWITSGCDEERSASLASLGFEPLEIRKLSFRSLLSGRHRQIKALLLDQRVLAGLGNIYTDEALHRSGVHPQTPASRLTPAQADRLWREIRAVLRHAIRAGGSTIQTYVDGNGHAGGFQQRHRVYARQGQPCSQCGGRIIKCRIAGRGTHLCPRCQPEPGGQPHRLNWPTPRPRVQREDPPAAQAARAL